MFEGKLLGFILVLAILNNVLCGVIPEGLIPQLDGRIIGGAPTSISNHPWQVSLQRNGGHRCGGSIYSANIIVTAAHCLQVVYPTQLKVRVGSTYTDNGGLLMDVAAFKNHERFDIYTMKYDIAVIRLSSSLSFSSTIKALPLAVDAPSDGAAAVVTGWGVTEVGNSTLPTTLQSVDVNIISLTTCASNSYAYWEKVKSGMICAAATGKDACQGDSGGPLVSGGVLVGVVSFGYGCARPVFPGVYADVAYLRNWIIDTSNKI